MQKFNLEESYGSQLGQNVYKCDKCDKSMPHDKDFIAKHNKICEPKKTKTSKKPKTNKKGGK